MINKINVRIDREAFIHYSYSFALQKQNFISVLRAVLSSDFSCAFIFVDDIYRDEKMPPVRHHNILVGILVMQAEFIICKTMRLKKNVDNV